MNINVKLPEHVWGVVGVERVGVFTVQQLVGLHRGDVQV